MRCETATNQLHGQRSRDGQPDKLSPETWRGLCPDELALIEACRAAGQYLSPRKAHAAYVAATEDLSGESFATVLTRVCGRSPANADPEGDACARRIDKERSRS